MPRPPSISFERFKEVASALRGEGKDLTYRLLRDRLGGGSNEVLGRYIDLFNQEAAAGIPGMPTNILSGAHALYEQAKADARKELLSTFAERERELDAEHAQLQSDRLELGERAARARGEAEVLRQQLRRVEEELERERQRSATLAGTSAQLEKELAAVKEVHNGSMRVEAAMVEQTASLQKALAEMSERGERLSVGFMQEVDHLRQSFKQLEASRRQELESLGKQLLEAREQLAQASIQLAQWQSKAGVLDDVRHIAAQLQKSLQETFEDGLRGLRSEADARRLEAGEARHAALQAVLKRLDLLAGAMHSAAPLGAPPATSKQETVKSRGLTKESNR